jgi:hypothetical protein
MPNPCFLINDIGPLPFYLTILGKCTITTYKCLKKTTTHHNNPPRLLMILNFDPNFLDKLTISTPFGIF